MGFGDATVLESFCSCRRPHGTRLLGALEDGGLVALDYEKHFHPGGSFRLDAWARPHSPWRVVKKESNQYPIRL